MYSKAKEEGISPQEVIDKYDGIIRKYFSDFGISFDNYSRTSAQIHHDTAQVFLKASEIATIYRTSNEQLYDANRSILADSRLFTELAQNVKKHTVSVNVDRRYERHSI
jgi:methionyl-tRNA synthetase